MKIQGPSFFDQQGRTLLLRGVNLGGSSKVPVIPDGATWRSDGFFVHRDVSFVGRPFPLEEAEEHFSRLQAWGLKFLRFVITWEAVEHAGPGEYDEAYLDYLRQVMTIAGAYDMQVWIDPHQDVWSRWTGGDGAPGWTLEACGFDLTKLHQTGAAIVHAMHGDPLPQMIWPTNHDKLGTATMFSLFFAGDDLAPHTTIQGESAQQYLQRHFLQAMQQVLLRLRDLPHVVGFGTMNEPGRGWIGLDLTQRPPSNLIKGPTPTPWQSILLGSGYPQTVAVYEPGPDGPEQTGEVTLNPNGLNVWRDGCSCPWKTNSVWTEQADGPALLRPKHCQQIRGREVDFANDYLKPFLLRSTAALREVRPETIVFLEGVPFVTPPRWEANDPDNVVHGVHWYDGVPLVLKVYNPEFTFDVLSGEFVMGVEAVRSSYRKQLAKLQCETQELMQDMPVCVGEFGLPFDLDDKAAYQTGDYTMHIQALDAYFSAMETLFLSCTLWNYTADNTNERGDHWNDEDLSIFSRDQQQDSDNIHSGGRALEAIVRPYPEAIAGHTPSFSYTLATKEFRLTYQNNEDIHAPTVIFVPSFVYPNGIQVEVSDGTYTYQLERCRLEYHHDADCEQHEIIIRPA